MKVPGDTSTGCVTTPNSAYCGTEFREVNPSDGSPVSWSPNASTNRLNAMLVVSQLDNSSRGTVIGQVHMDDRVLSKPVCELYYNSNGVLSMGMEQTRSGGNEKYTQVDTVPVGTEFTYEIRYEGNVLTVSINGGNAQTLDTYSLDAPASYFKAGNYNQGSSPSNVHFFSLSVEH
jgi:hypothetical protein